jgi:hypothetical protein
MTDAEKVLQSKRDRLAALDKENGEVYAELQAGFQGFTMNTVGARQELLLDYLKESIWSEEQSIDFEIKFHERVKEAMKEPLEKLQEARRRQNFTVVKNPTSLVDKNGRPLT